MKTDRGYHLFTPRVPGPLNVRAFMELDDKDLAKIKRGRPWSATVLDHASGRRFKVRGSSCGLPRCFCAATIVKELP